MFRLDSESGFVSKSFLSGVVACLAVLAMVLALAAFSTLKEEQAKAASHDREIRARLDFVQALDLAAQGSKAEALALLAQSLRLQPQNNPAASIAFQLLGELRVNTDLELRGHTDAVLCANFNPAGTEIVTASKDHTARIWNALTGQQFGPALQQDGDIVTAEFSPDGTRVVTGTEDGVAQVWNALTGKTVGAAIKETDTIRSVHFSPDGKLVATASDDSIGRIWNAETGQPVMAPLVYHGNVFSVCFSPDGSRVVTATSDGRSDIWNIQAGGKIAHTLRHDNSVTKAVFNFDGTRILTASADGSSKIWDAKTGNPMPAMFRHGALVADAAFSPNGSLAASASWDHTAQVWDSLTGQAVSPPLLHGDAVMSVAFNPSGTRVATTARDHTARVWDARSGDPVILPLRVTGQVNSATFSPDGQSLLIASSEPVVRLVALPPEDSAPAWLADLADFASTQVRYDGRRTADLDGIRRLRQTLLGTTSPSPWEQFGRWYFLESDVRPVSPWSNLSLKEYVFGLMARPDKASIDYAISLAHNEPQWMVQLMAVRAKLNYPQPEKP